MSDITDLIEGRFGKDPMAAVGAFISKEWANTQHLIAQAPADLQPALKIVQEDAKIVLADAIQWGGTALSAYIASRMGPLQSELVQLLSGALAGSSPTSAAGQTLIQGVTALINGIVAHEIGAFTNAQLPAPAPPST
jgi:hypothetical protein